MLVATLAVQVILSAFKAIFEEDHLIGPQDGVWRQTGVEIAAGGIGGKTTIVAKTHTTNGQESFFADGGNILTQLTLDGIEVRLVVVQCLTDASNFRGGGKDAARGKQNRQEHQDGDKQFNEGEGALHDQSSRTVTYTGSMRRPERSVTGTNQIRSTVWYQ